MNRFSKMTAVSGMVGRVVVINDFSVARGGATVLALLSLRLLRSLNIPTTYIVGDKGDNSLFNEIGVDVVTLGEQAAIEGRSLWGAVQGIYNKTARDRLAHWIQKNDCPDIIYHVHVWSKILSPQIFSALKPVAARTVIHAHDFFLVCPNGGQFHFPRHQPCHLKPLGAACLTTNCDKRRYSDKLWRSARQAVLRNIMNFKPGFPRIVLIHDKMTPYFVHAGVPQERLQVIRNPVTPFTESRVPVETNKFVYFIGRLVPEKGIDDAIRASRIAQMPLRVIGDGPLYQELIDKYPDVEFLGWRPTNEIGGIIKDARIVVMPTHYPEPFGLVALEAACSGIPVIISDSAFVAEEFVNKGIGFACNPRNHQLFAELLRRLADMPFADLTSMSQRAATLAPVSAMTPESWCNELLACYDKALSTARRSS